VAKDKDGEGKDGWLGNVQSEGCGNRSTVEINGWRDAIEMGITIQHLSGGSVIGDKVRILRHHSPSSAQHMMDY
jgi:hypothetical protein